LSSAGCAVLEFLYALGLIGQAPGDHAALRSVVVGLLAVAAIEQYKKVINMPSQPALKVKAFENIGYSYA
jgi:hypothetical protein